MNHIIKPKQTLTTLLTLILLLLLLLLSACGSSTPPPTETETIQVQGGQQVSYHAEAGAGSYSWKQLSGTTVVLVDTTSATLSFMAPVVTDESELRFELTAVREGVPRVTVLIVVVLPDGGVRVLTLIVDKTSLNREENSTVKVMATYSDNSTKEVTDTVEWIVIPGDAVKVVGSTLTALQDSATTVKAKLNGVVSDAVNLNITWVVNGHVLPPEPDKAINDSTLLGIDVNNNNVRDDVERYIYKRFPKEDYPKTRTALAMQYAWANQKIIEKPTRESAKYIHDSIDCEYYWYGQKQRSQKQQASKLLKTDRRAAFEISVEMTKWQLKYQVFDDDGMNNIIFNTRERTKRDFSFNGAMSGGFFPGRDESIENCQTNIDLLGE